MSQQWEIRSLSKNLLWISGADKSCFRCAGSLIKFCKILTYLVWHIGTQGTIIMIYRVHQIGTQGVNIFPFIQISRHLIWMHSLSIFTGSSGSHNNNKRKLLEIWMSPDQMHIASNLMSLCFCESMSNFLYLLKNRLLAILYLKLGANEDKSRKSKPFLSFFLLQTPTCSGRLLCTLIVRL